MMEYKKLLAFIKRDFLVETSYRLSFFLQFFGTFIIIFSCYFISKLVGESAAPFLSEYGGNYFSFVLIGIAFLGYLQVGMKSFSDSVREAQMTGTLEAMLSTPTKLSTILIASSLWSFIFTSFSVIIYLLFGALFFNVNMSHANILTALVVLILTIVSFSGLGIISASFIMTLKRGDPITWILTSLSSLLGGVFYPITVMPGFLQVISFLLPITHSLRAMRLALLQGYSISSLSSELLALLVFSIILIPLSLAVFKIAVRKAKIDGSLAKY